MTKRPIRIHNSIQGFSLFEKKFFRKAESLIF